MGEEVHHAGSVPLGEATDGVHTLRNAPDLIGPDIAVRIGVLFRLAGLPEPGMLRRRVSGDQVQQNMHSPLVGLGKKVFQVLVGAVPGGYRVIIRHVVACVQERRGEAGVQPQGVAAQLPDVVQAMDDAGNIADAVGIGVLKGLGVNFIENCVFEPCRHTYPSDFSVFWAEA